MVLESRNSLSISFHIILAVKMHSFIRDKRKLKHKDGINDLCNNYFDSRNLLGEDLGPLTGKELDTLEKQLDVSLKHIRSTRVLLFTFYISLFKTEGGILKRKCELHFIPKQLKFSSMWNTTSLEDTYGTCI